MEPHANSLMNNVAVNTKWKKLLLHSVSWQMSSSPYHHLSLQWPYWSCLG